MRASRRIGWFTWVGISAAGVVLLLSGHLLGRVSAPPPPVPSRSAGVPVHGDVVRPSPSPPSPRRLGLVAPPAGRIVPITGPNRPPLPRERRGPYGGRITTGLPDVALTFDDGPDPDWTPGVLEMLRQYHIKATFCVIGVNVQEFPDLVRDIVAEGHTLCNHSWAHDIRLGRHSSAWIMSDLRRTNAAIRAAVPDAKISYYRQPGGAWTPAIVAAAARLGMSALHWQVDPQDWRTPGSYAIASAVIAATRPGSIVLMHDGGGNRSGTVTALHTILPNLVARFALEALPPGVDPPRLYGIDLPLHTGQS